MKLRKSFLCGNNNHLKMGDFFLQFCNLFIIRLSFFVNFVMIKANFFVRNECMNRKSLKQKAKKAFQQNYWRCFAVSFLITLLVGGTIVLKIQDTNQLNLSNIPLTAIDGKSNSVIVNEFLQGVTEEESQPSTPGFVGAIADNVSKAGSFLFGILNAINQFLFHDQILAGIIIIFGVVLSILYWLFFSTVFEVSKVRFFLENRLYSSTTIGRTLLPFRIRKNFHIALVQISKFFHQLLWLFTIVGGPIKIYAYRMVPYLLAENPELKSREVLSISSQMMYGHKWELFLLDCSFLGWGIVGFFTLNIFNLFYTNPYKSATMAEFYMNLRHFCIKQGMHCFPDSYLAENPNGLKEYPEEKYFLKEHSSRKFLKQLDYNRAYSLSSYILFFFSFSFLGWLWEVGITLFGEGIFVNRGALYGPWLPIYGSGGVLILFLLKDIRHRPILLFFLTVLICGVVEYGTSFYLETFKHLKWWDYTGFFLNLHGRICFEGLFFFGLGGLFFVYVLAPILDNFYRKWNPHWKSILCIVLVLCIGVDFLYSSKHPNVGEGITTEIVS